MRALKHPEWLKKKVVLNSGLDFTKSVIAEFGINTVCQSARCPNIFECFSRKTATFLILGNRCTRGCAFCSVEKSAPRTLDQGEPGRVSQAARALGLRHVVITSVTRDDLADGGSGQFARTIEAVRKRMGGDVEIEVLVPDFRGRKKDIKTVVGAGPDIFSHNMETVPGLYARIRPGADYNRSLNVLKLAKEIDPKLITKSAFMLGLGETEEEVIALMNGLLAAGCDQLAIGQYLRPSRGQIEVKEYVSPEMFARYKELGYTIGFRQVQSGPFVRSSYRSLASE
ncbi:MAG: lipoyl synthase [Candidatus Omnitrophica bacterium]|nr:lipoyl synthase [Candidatus Omnitrophota bacterium]